MATKSILKSIVIRDKKSLNRLLAALENSKSKRDMKFSPSVSHQTITGDAVRKLFQGGEAKD